MIQKRVTTLPAFRVYMWMHNASYRTLMLEQFKGLRLPRIFQPKETGSKSREPSHIAHTDAGPAIVQSHPGNFHIPKARGYPVLELMSKRLCR